MNIQIQGVKVLHTIPSCYTTQEDIFISEGAIVALGTPPPGFVAARVMNAKGKLAMPGLINCHTHSYMSLFRNFADDLCFEDWLFKKVMPIEDRMTAEDAYWCNLLSFIEMIRSGTTCFNDMHMFKHQGVAAAEEAGLRAVFGRGLSCGGDDDPGGQRRIDEAMEEISACQNPLIRFVLAPHAVYTCNEGFLRHVATVAAEKHLPVHIHVSETQGEVERCKATHGGLSPVEYLAGLGLFDVPALAAHCVWVDDRDLAILNEQGVSIATNPVSNMKLASGVMPLNKVLASGVNLCIGSDSAASNNTQNMFKELSAFSYIHKAITLDPLVAPADFALRCATVNGAKALGLEGLVGSIAPGMRADIALLDLHRPQFMPQNDLVTALAYSANGSEVETLLVDGEILMEKGNLKTLDEERIYSEIERIRQKYLV